MMRRAIVESPYRGNSAQEREANIAYAKQCCKFAANLGFVPFASHLFFPQFLNEDIPDERQNGIEMGYDFWEKSDVILFFIDRGMSPGMEKALAKAFVEGKPVRKVSLETVQQVQSIPTAGELRAPRPEDFAPRRHAVDLDQIEREIKNT